MIAHSKNLYMLEYYTLPEYVERQNCYEAMTYCVGAKMEENVLTL